MAHKLWMMLAIFYVFYISTCSIYVSANLFIQNYGYQQKCSWINNLGEAVSQGPGWGLMANPKRRYHNYSDNQPDARNDERTANNNFRCRPTKLLMFAAILIGEPIERLNSMKRKCKLKIINSNLTQIEARDKQNRRTCFPFWCILSQRFSSA